MAIEDLRKNRMMTHLLDALDRGEDIGHYGRLVFAIVARHFVDEGELVGWLRKDPDVDEREARGLVQQVNERDYNPPRRDKILAWQGEQEFPIIPDSHDPAEGNVYRDLKFPDHVYEQISEYHEQKAT